MIGEIKNKFYFLEKNGVAHGLVMVAVLALAWFVIPSYYAVVAVGVVGSVYYYQREAIARKTWNILNWYTDSQFDAITPAVVSGVAIYLRYF